MAGFFGLSINPKYAGNFLRDLFLGTFYQQHLGEEYCGLSTCNQGRFRIRTSRGLFRPAFFQNLEGLEGTEGIGYCGPDEEPFLVDSRLGQFSACFSGNIINCSELVSKFKSSGHLFSRSEGQDDIEVITKLVVQGKGFIDGICGMAQEIKGAYSLLLLTTEGVYAVRSPDGHWPLVIAEKEGTTAAAFDSGGFRNMGFKSIHELEPGEIVLMKDGCWRTVAKMTTAAIQFCSFCWVYTLFPSAVFQQIPSSVIRKRLGAALARRDIENGFIPDIVAPVPDSGRFHAIGYIQEFWQQMNAGKITKAPLYDELLLKYPYAGRSFTQQSAEGREKEARMKLLGSAEDYYGKSVVINEDSIVRGTQIGADAVPKLRSLGIAEVHLRVSNPELRSYCPWGKTTKKGEMLAPQKPLPRERADFLGVDSLEYNSIKDLVAAIGFPKTMLCLDCDITS